MNDETPSLAVRRQNTSQALFKQCFFASRELIKAVFRERRPRRSAMVLSVCIIAAVLVDERVVRFLPDGAFRNYVFDVTYVAKWEFFALLATLIITWMYWYSQMGNHAEIEVRFLRAANLCLGISVILLIAAICTLVLGAAGNRVFVYIHLVLIWLVALLFLLNDLLTWQGMLTHQKALKSRLKDVTKAQKELEDCLTENDRKTSDGNILLQDEVKQLTSTIKSIGDHKSESLYGLIAADIPMCIAFSCLLAFLILHNFEHDTFSTYRSAIANNHFLAYALRVPANRTKVLDMWASKEYFVGGAIAFQYLVSTVVYILIAAQVLGRSPENIDE